MRPITVPNLGRGCVIFIMVKFDADSSVPFSQEMENLSADDLASCLQAHLNSELVQALRAQDVTGATFLLLNCDVLKAFGFSLSSALDILRVQQGIGSKRINLVEQAASFAPSCSSAAISSGCSNVTNRDLIEIEEGDDSLLEYMTQQEISKLSDYEKENLKAHVRNHRVMIAHGLATGSVPSVFRRSVRGGCSTTASSAHQVLQPISPPRRSAGLTLMPLSAERSDDDGGSSAEENQNPNEVKGMYKPNSLRRSVEDLKAIAPHLLPVFEIEPVLDGGSTKRLLKFLQDGYILVSKHRKVVFRTLMKHLAWKYLKHPNEITSSLMERLAKSVCVSFPQYQKPIDVKDKTPWSHIFSPAKGTGHFANILKRIQSSLPKEERKRNGKAKRKQRETQSEREALAEAKKVNVQTLALIFPGRGERESILDGMRVTYPLRKIERSRGESIVFFISTYPHFLNYNGELISEEFKMICPDASDMCPVFQGHIDTILSEWKTEAISSRCKDEVIDACLTLAAKLPHVILGNTGELNFDDQTESVIPCEDELILVIKPSDDIEEAVLSRIEKANYTSVQPYLMAVRSTTTSSFVKFFIALDGRAMDLGRIPTLRAIDWLFKAFVTFNVHFPSTWSNFFRLLQTCYYKVYFQGEDDAPPTAIEVFRYLEKS